MSAQREYVAPVVLSEVEQRALIDTVIHFWGRLLAKRTPVKFMESGYKDTDILRQFYDCADAFVGAANWQRHNRTHQREMSDYQAAAKLARARKEPE